MVYSKTGLHLTESFEGCKLTAYPDQGGVWTIGYGHTRGVTAGTTCTQAQAEAWLMQDVQDASKAVSALVRVPLTQPEFDALVDFTFNLGTGSLKSSICLRKLNGGDYHGAADEFLRWDKVKGVEVAGLLRRRKAEHDLFES